MALLALFLIIDIAIAWHLFKEAFVVRSNKSRQYRRWFFIMLAVIAGALVLQGFNRVAACWLAGVPACLAGGFAVLLGIALFTGKSRWQ